jgi:hypothetical protein
VPKRVQRAQASRASVHRIHLWIHAREPLAGEVSADGEVPASFEGWLDLLERLFELVVSDVSDPGIPDRRSR